MATAVTSVLFPVMAGCSTAHAKEMHDQALRLVLYAALAVVLSVWWLGHLLLVRIYGAEFGPAAVLLRILIAEAALTCIGQVLVQLFLSLHRPGYGSLAQIVSLAVAAIGLAFLVPRFGAEGAALSLLAAAAVRLAVLLAGIPLRLGLSLPRLYPTRADSLYLWGRLT